MNGTMEVLAELELSFVCEEDPGVGLVRRRTAASEALAMDITRRLVVNPEDVSGSGAVLVEPKELAWGQYVIITHPDYQDQAQELADWEDRQGNTRIGLHHRLDPVPVLHSGPPAGHEGLLTHCRDQGTDYVLIFGDDDKVECRDALLVGSSSYTEEAPSDLYFADINDTAPGADLWNSNGNNVWGEVPYPYQYPQPAGYDQVDYHPDLWVGRASVNSVPRLRSSLRRCSYTRASSRWTTSRQPRGSFALGIPLESCSPSTTSGIL